MTTVVLVQQGGTGANSAAAARAALSVPSSNDVVSKSGDTMTGQLNISSGGLLVTGNVGVGMANPTHKLSVYGTVSETNPVFGLLSGKGSTTFNDGAQIAFGYNGTAQYMHFVHTRHNAGSANNSIDFYVSNGTQFNSPTSGSIHVMSLNSGNVGIGTTSPTANLHVTGTIKDTPVVSITGNQTYADNAAGRVIFANTTSAITITAAAAATAGFSYTVIRGNTGNVTIANSGVTRLNSASITTMNVNQYGAVTVVYTATNQVIVFGDFVA